ncbi:glycoside hydrolase family 75 protein [Streptomyces sp. NPDC006798]|uniref:glycoside hydrolase family 75 protein n=1 Tax=Streptomyces sp. NPDC006798 TaxID=3155462 RepID=UPI0033DAB3F0
MHVRTLAALATASGAAFLAAAAPAPPAAASFVTQPPPGPRSEGAGGGGAVAMGATGAGAVPVVATEATRAVRAVEAVEAEGAVGADELRASTAGCDPVSKGSYAEDAGAEATVPVCGAKGAVYWKADLDVACDGLESAICNRENDPWYLPDTAVRQSDGRPLDAATLPYVVVPTPGPIWKYYESGIRGGGIVAVVHRDRVRYGVVGDTGPAKIIGEASYAMARALGIDSDPVGGGVPSGVTYILFAGSEADPVESRTSATTRGEELARAFLTSN